MGSRPRLGPATLPVPEKFSAYVSVLRTPGCVTSSHVRLFLGVGLPIRREYFKSIGPNCILKVVVGFFRK